MTIRVRLGLWYGAIFGIAIVVFSLGIYALMARHLERMVDRALDDATAHVGEMAMMVQMPMAIPASHIGGVPDVFVQVHDPDGRIIAGSENLGGRALPLPAAGLTRGESTVKLDELTLKTRAAEIVVNGRVAGWFVAGASYEMRDSVLGPLRWGLAGGGVLSAVAVGLLGGALAGRALSPVTGMADAARSIAREREFERRLPARNPRDELGRLAEALNEMLASLGRAYAAQERFAGDASHQLRNPLASIQGNLGLLERTSLPADERAQILTEIRREVARLVRLVNHLLVIARVDSGGGADLHDVELDALLIEAHRVAIEADQVAVRIGHIEPLVARGDPDRLRELLLILLDNAVRYTPAGGNVSVSLASNGDWAVVTVEDRGIGIAPEELPHIFDRFWRSEAARRMDSGGAGLGLSIARTIAEDHGGQIAVESAPGEGSKFTVRLPLGGSDRL